jgi:glutathione peroxidase
MKLFFILCILYSGNAFSQSSIYDLDVRTPDGNTINMSNYKGQKILIVSVTAENLLTKDLHFWDSLQRTNAPIAVVLIPANDLGKPFDDSTIEVIKNILSKNLILSASAKVKKAEAQNQDPIFQWLTHSDRNAHFNADVTTNKQIYIVSESGILYAVLEQGVPVTVIDRALKQKDVTQ